MIKNMDDSQEDPAAVFAIPDFWKSSKWLHSLNGDPNAKDPFFSPGLRGTLRGCYSRIVLIQKYADDIDSDLVQLGEVSVEQSGFFKLPTQFGLQLEPEPETDVTASDDVPATAESLHSLEPETDIWAST